MDPNEKEAAERGYVVVKFLDDESVSEVPKLWIIEESGVQTQCQWPSHANNVSNLIAKYATPTPRWQKFNVDIIKDKCCELSSHLFCIRQIFTRSYNSSCDTVNLKFSRFFIQVYLFLSDLYLR